MSYQPLKLEIDSEEFAKRYFKASSKFAALGQEERLTFAWELAREALGGGISLAEINGMHNDALRDLFQTGENLQERFDRLEQFFLEVVAVYDMALRGFRSSVEELQAENAKRRQAERKLLDLTEELKLQRDTLDVEVQLRTRELATKAAELEQSNEELRQANREQSEFTYAISHDLKSPANTIGMLISELFDEYGDDLNSEACELIDQTLQTVERMKQLVDDVLGYSRTIEHGFTIARVDMDRLVGEIIADLKGDIVQHDIEINVARLPVIEGNAFQLRILFQNLISNAIKFRSPDRPAQVSIYSTKNPQTKILNIVVSDNGIGIAPKFHDNIFALFQRLHTHDDYPGSGLGLTLCRRIAMNHSGKINVDSAPGSGSNFSLELAAPRI